MLGKPPGPLVIGITATLEREGEATLAELCKIMGIHRFDASSVLSRMRRPLKLIPKRVYVVRWTYYDDSGGRNYLKPVYALGDNPDAPKPKPRTAKESARKWRESERHRVNSVFMWAQPRKIRHAMRRGENP